MMTVKILVLCTFAVLLVNCDENLQEQNQDNLDPIIDHDDIEKEHNKRTIFGHGYHPHGWAKHIKFNGGRKVILGFGPVDLKYVPVVKPVLHKVRNSWRFQQRPRPVHKPIIHTDGWKPILTPAHIPSPPSVQLKPWQEQGWNHKPVNILNPVPAVQQPVQTTVLKPSVPLVSDHVHHIDHVHHGGHIHQHDHIEPVLRPAQPVVPTVVQSVAPTVVIPTVNPVVQPVLPPARPIIQPIIPQRPHIFYYNPLLQVQKPNLPVLPLGATFPTPVLQQQPTVTPQIPQIPHVHQYPNFYQVSSLYPNGFIPQTPVVAPTPVHQHHVHGPPVFAHNIPHVHSVQSVQPIQPVQPYQPYHPFQSIQPIRPIQPIQPIQPVQPVQTHYHTVQPSVTHLHPVPPEAPHFYPVQPQVPVQPEIPHFHQIQPTVPATISHIHPEPPGIIQPQFPQPTVQPDMNQIHAGISHISPIPQIPQHHQIQETAEPNYAYLPPSPQPHLPQVHEPSQETSQNLQAGTTIEYHGHQAHLIQSQYQQENYNPNILPGSDGHPQDLSNFFPHNAANPEEPVNDPNHGVQYPDEIPNGIQPGVSDLQIPLHLPQHPNYSPENFNAHQGFFGFPDGIVQPSIGLEPPYK